MPHGEGDDVHVPWLSRVVNRIGKYVDDRVMVSDSSGFHVDDSGWPTGIRPTDIPVEKVEELLDTTFREYWKQDQVR